ncbi:MAG TPA: type VI secretion protein IcmF/TssM N-terminal domain-containing protein [Pyrinomonadaceae bacterium]|jgi:hypothetical protein
MLSPYWPYILLATLLLALCAALALLLVLRRARRRAAAPPAADAPQVGFIQRPAASSLGMKLSFVRALRALRGHVTLRDYRYRLPWFLLVGEEGSGKTTLLRESGMHLPLDPPAEQMHGVKQEVNWFFYDRAVVLDVAGELVLRSDSETSNRSGWATVSRLLQKHRPERPLDGVVLTVPASDLVAARGLAPDQRARIEQKAVGLYRKLWEAQKQLGMSFPVYVVVTKCDQVPGFQSFCRELPERLRDEMFGWSSHYTLETAYRPEWVVEAFQNVNRYLFQAQVEMLTESCEVRDRDGIFLLPSEVQQLRAPLQLYLDQVFKESSFHDSFFFRGLYFCGDAGEEVATPAVRALLPPAPDAAESYKEWLEEALKLDRQDDAPEAPAAQQKRRPAFVRDLFEKKIFQEGMLARPLVKARLSRNRTAFAAQVLSLAIPIGGCLGLLLTYAGLEGRRDELYAMLRQEEQDLAEVRNLRDGYRARPRLSDFYGGFGGESSYGAPPAQARPAVYTDAALPPQAAADDAPGARPLPSDGGLGLATHDNLHNMLAAMSRVHGGKLYSVFIPTSWFSDLNAHTRASIVDGFEHIIFEGLRSELDDRTDAFLQAAPIYASAASAPGRRLASAPGAAPPSADPASPPTEGVYPLYDQRFVPGDDGTLHGFIERFAELRSARALYEGLRAGSGSLEDLKSLNAYLGHKEPAEDFDARNPLFTEAVHRAKGHPLTYEAKDVLRAVEENVAGMVEALYHRSFERQTSGVSYVYLGDVAQTEALLARPEHTWLSTYVFDGRSAFYGMTLSAGMHELRVALEGLRHEGFMSPGAAGAAGFAPRPRREMVWDGGLLRRAAAYADDYERFAAGRCDRSNPLNDTVCQTAFARMRANVAALVRQAQSYRPAPAAPGQPAELAGLEAEVRSLKAEQETLSKLLATSDRLSLQEGLRPALAGQAQALLRAADRLFPDGNFYPMARPDFSEWDGSTPVAAWAFGADSLDGVAAYLAQQRKEVAYLARELAAPVLDFAAASGVPAPRTRVDWKGLLALLADYDEKKPGNSLSQLESFILTGMDKANPARCQEIDGGGDGPSARDLFLMRRNQLRGMLRSRCDAIAADRARREELLLADRGRRAALVAVAGYREIAERFNDKLAGRFPFAAPVGPPYAEADPRDVLAFFDLLKEKGPVARRALRPAHLFGADGDAALEFLDRMDEVRAFFAEYLEKRKGPALDFNLEFRVNREHEEGASQISDWTFEVGGRKFSHRDKELTGRWAFGEPVQLTLRWADNSPQVPDASEGGPFFRAGNRVAVYQYRNRWSLLMMLLRQQTPASDFSPEGADSGVYTLWFTVPTHPDGKYFDSMATPLRSNEARVFIRLALLGPGAKEHPLPYFPKSAPGMYHDR